jgi:hypothetical protein
MVEIVAAEGRIAAGGHHLEHAFRQAQDGNVEGAAAEVEHRVDALSRIVEAVGDRRRGRFIEQAQHIQAGQPRRVLGGLALGIVEIGRHGDHRAGQFAAQRGLGPVTHRLQDFRRDFHRALDAGDGPQLDHALRVEEIVRQGFDVGDVLAAAPHEALDRNNGVLGIDRLLGLRVVADLDAAIYGVGDHRGQQGPAHGIVEHHAHAAPDRRHKGIGGAEIDADRKPMLVRSRGLSRFRNLK